MTKCTAGRQGDRLIGKVIRNYKDFVATCVDKLQIID